VQTRPASLLLSQGQALGVAHDLTDARMAEQVRVHRRWITVVPVSSTAS
jgi:hypothetical protein